MISVNTWVLLLAPTAARVLYNMSGLKDFRRAANHLSHFRITEAAVSALQGVACLGYSVAFASLAVKPFMNRFGVWFEIKPSMITEFQPNSNPSYLTRVLFHQSYLKGSDASSLADFCLRYLQDYPVNYYDVAADCIQPLANREPDEFKSWVLKDSIKASYYTGFTADHVAFENHQPMNHCTENNKRYGQVFRGGNQIVYDYTYKNINQQNDCVLRRIQYLKEIFNQPTAGKSLSLAERGCFSFGEGKCDAIVSAIKAAFGQAGV